MQKWEYRIDQVEAMKTMDGTLNGNGEEGWELVAVETANLTKTGAMNMTIPYTLWTLYVKRPKP